ncbi:phospholipase A [Endozoicomonas sp. Mp262]|uniref:phospholipase A n=1 Tax=Endozoicomonas sp. Mp262 TaxID=2919499 RepID=UPI0021D95356
MTVLKKTDISQIICSKQLFLAVLPCFFIASDLRAETYEQCLMRQARFADESLTLSEIRAACQQKLREDSQPEDTLEEADVLANRAVQEETTRDSPFVITPHRPNYILPVSYNASPNYEPFERAGEQAAADNFSSTEIKFQLSVKAPVFYGVFNGYGDLYVAYTNTSWWQAYNSHSSPFRETNHEPEAFLVFPVQYEVMGLNLRAITTGINHQSNGRGGSLSRSWNRVYANFILQQENFYMSFKPWWRIPEKDKKFDGDPQGDDNPDIDQYMGYGELRLGYQINSYNFAIMLRNNLRYENKGAVQLDWSFPINKRFKGYVQYFNGYGESLIDYNDSVNRLSVGVMLTDWL